MGNENRANFAKSKFPLVLRLLDNDLTSANRPSRTGSHPLPIILQVFEILVHAIRKQDLAATRGSASRPSPFHFVDLLPSSHADFLILDALLLLLHLGNPAGVPGYVALAFFPFFENNFRHDLPIFSVILLLLFNGALLLLLHHLESLLVRLLDETIFQPSFKLFLSL